MQKIIQITGSNNLNFNILTQLLEYSIPTMFNNERTIKFHTFTYYEISRSV